MRERNRYAGGKELLKALGPKNDKVRERKDGDEAKEELSPLELRGCDRERQRHKRHHPSVTRDDEAREGHRFTEVARNVGQESHGQEFGSIEDKSRKGEPDDGQPGSNAVLDGLGRAHDERETKRLLLVGAQL